MTDAISTLEGLDLRKRFPGRRGAPTVTAVDGVSLSVRAGRTVAVVGESGCGKSTLGRLLMGLVEPDEGSVNIDGRPLTAMTGGERAEYRRAVQMVFQDPLGSFNPMLSIETSLQDAMRLRDDLDRAGRAELAERLLARVRLSADLLDRRPGELSGGQLQRVGIARALATEPRIVFLDEPTSALDMSVRGQVLELLIELQRETGVGYVLVSHDLRVVRAVADDVIVMYLGHVVEEGPLEQVIDRPLHPYTRALLETSHLRPREGDRLPVRGELAELPDGYDGCKFIARCPFRREECQRPQGLAPSGAAHRVRCWRAPDIEDQPPPETPELQGDPFAHREAA